MLFNSYEFIYFFMPVVLTLFFALGRFNHTYALSWLLFASLFYYAWWKPIFVVLLLFSILFNYVLGRVMLDRLNRERPPKGLLIFGIVGNLATLGYFKYALFFVDNINFLFGTALSPGNIILPIGISFYTFTEIAYLVEVYQGKVRETNFLRYALFESFFPQLIAGPVLYHREIIPQFERSSAFRYDAQNFSVGLTIFFIGLFKKVVLADGIIYYLSDLSLQPAFWKVSHGIPVSFFESWIDVLAYTLQLYFDFSGYSDMAIGLSRLFGITLPVNFNSPYKAVDISDFWRRWHMTLGRFLRYYVYIPLGGNRCGETRRLFNMFVVMLLCGLWHGAGWTFVIWGGLHGVYLIVNQGWLRLRRSMGWHERAGENFGGRAITFLAVVVSWVIFRADSVNAALAMLKGMAGLNGFVLAEADRASLGLVGTLLAQAGVRFDSMFYLPVWSSIGWIGTLLTIVWFAPNTQQIMARFNPVLDTLKTMEETMKLSWLVWQPKARWILVVSILAVASIVFLRSGNSPFLYFRF